MPKNKYPTFPAIFEVDSQLENGGVIDISTLVPRLKLILLARGDACAPDLDHNKNKI